MSIAFLLTHTPTSDIIRINRNAFPRGSYWRQSFPNAFPRGEGGPPERSEEAAGRMRNAGGKPSICKRLQTSRMPSPGKLKVTPCIGEAQDALRCFCRRQKHRRDQGPALRH